MALYRDDDEELAELLRHCACWLENEGAHNPSQEEYRAMVKRAKVCRAAAARLEQILTVTVEPSGPPRLRLADQGEDE